MQAYLIDPARSHIEAVAFEGDYKLIQTMIGADLFTVVNLNDSGDAVYVDDEGLMKPQTHFFKIAGYPQPLAGKGLVLGTDSEGDSTSPTINLAAIREMITYHTADELGFDPSDAPMNQTTEFDPVFVPFEPDSDDFSDAADFIAKLLHDEQIDRLVAIMQADSGAADATRGMIEHIDLYREALARYDAANAGEDDAKTGEFTDTDEAFKARQAIHIDGDKEIDLTIGSEQT